MPPKQIKCELKLEIAVNLLESNEAVMRGFYEPAALYLPLLNEGRLTWFSATKEASFVSGSILVSFMDCLNLSMILP